MDAKLSSWRASGKYLPTFMRDFHAQKDIFRTMHEMFGDEPKDAVIKRPSWVEGHCYVIDCFLWFMARYGYTLQRSKADQNFESLEDAVSRMRTEQLEKFNAMMAAELASRAQNAATHPDASSK